jgi:multiple sugar transport system substrate-binding protein
MKRNLGVLTVVVGLLVMTVAAGVAAQGPAAPNSGRTTVAQSESPAASAVPETPAPTPQITQPPAQTLSQQCQAAGGSTASMAPVPTGGVIDWAKGISGPVTISGWQSTGAEGDALTQTLCAAQAALPNLQITYQPIAGDYQAVMAANIAARQVPDLFYVDPSYSDVWINQGFLEPLDPYIQKSGFDTSAFFPGYANIFKGADGMTYGFPKDGNTIAMAYNSDMVTDPPKTLDDLVSWATANKGKAGSKAPLCLNNTLDRGLAFIYAQGGSLISDDGKTATIDSDASKAAVQWYLDLFKNGLGMTASDMGDGWCGDALGKGDAAIIFEGGWLDPAMTSTYPDIHYAWAPMPVGSSGSPVTLSYTVSYSIGADSANKDQAFALLSYLTGPVGMQVWTQGGIALPSRSDVPTPPGKDVLTAGSAYAKPGSGFMPNYTDVQNAFGAEMTNQIQSKTFDAGPVVDKTKAAIDAALSGQ